MSDLRLLPNDKFGVAKQLETLYVPGLGLSERMRISPRDPNVNAGACE
jgi:hypothetical protein